MYVWKYEIIVIFSTVEMSFSAKDFVTEEDVCFRFVGSLQWESLIDTQKPSSTYWAFCHVM